MPRSCLPALLLFAACESSSTPPPQAPDPAPASATPATRPELGVAVVFEAFHLWIGYSEPPPELRLPEGADGHYAELSLGLDKLAKAKVPADAVVISYGAPDRARVRWNGALRDLRGPSVGLQDVISRDEEGLPELQREVGPALDLAVAELARMHSDRKVLILIGDGGGAPASAATRQALAAAGVDLRAIYLATEDESIEGEPGQWRALTDKVILLEHPEQLPDTLAEIGRSLGS
jgi:hypothetical protein